MDYDVIVIGGGPAGSVAATQAARLGARCLLVEKNGVQGGTTTSAGMNVPGLFHAWGRQVIAGIGWELVSRAVHLACGELPDFTDYHRAPNKLQVRVNGPIYVGPGRRPTAWRRDRPAAAGRGHLCHHPKGAMLPAGSARLLAAGRCVTGDQEANSAYRVQASCMAMGQAAGAISPGDLG